MEEWRNVPGYDNYQVSIDTKEGRCRNIEYRGRVRELKNIYGQKRIHSHLEDYWRICLEV